MQGEVTQVALLFLRLGFTAFGGPAAHVAMMQDEVVRRRGWLTTPELLDLVGAANLIPGPSSTELAMHIGHRRAGALGLVVAGACFIVPAALITLALAWAYVRFGARPEAAGLLYGVKPVIVAVVAHALWKLGRAAVRTRRLALLGAVAVVATAMRADELTVLLVAGAIGMSLAARRHPASVFAPLAGTSGAKVVLALATPASIFLVFLKIGSVLFGSGYVLLAFLRADLVEARGWLTEGQLVDAVAAGQVTPGPVFTTATFVGYVVGGPLGALAATVGIFLPSFLFVAASGALVPRLRGSVRAAGFLDGVNVASLALMAVVTADLARASLVDVPAVLLTIASAVLLVRYQTGAAWLVLGGAALGVARRAFQG